MARSAAGVAIQMRCGFGGAGNDEDGGVSGFIVKNIVFQGLHNVLHECGFTQSLTTSFASGPTQCKLASIWAQRPDAPRNVQVDMYSQILAGADTCALRYDNVVGTLGVLDTMVLQDNLCKFVEVLQTLSTGCFFGKAHAEALEMFGWRRPEAGEHS